MQALKFNARNYAKIVAPTKRKRTTIRLGHKPTKELGRVVILCEEQPTPDDAEITEIRVVRFGSLGLSDAVEHGYMTVRDLKNELQACYQQEITASDVITIIRFELEGDE